MKKKFLICFLIGTLMVSVMGCSSKDTENTQISETISTETIEKESTEKENTEKTEERESFVRFDYLGDTTEVSIEKYKGLSLDVQPTQVTDEDIESELNYLLDSQEFYEKKLDGVVETGDTVNIDFVGTINGEEFDNGSATNYNLTTGNNSMIAGFEDAIIGAKVGDTVTANCYFDEDYGIEDLNGKDAQFVITINYICGEKITPELTDEFISTYTNYDSLDAYKKYIKDYIEDYYSQDFETNKKDYYSEAVMKALIDNNTITSLNKEDVVSYYNGMVDYYKNYAEYLGYSFETFCDTFFNFTEDEFYDHMEDISVQYIAFSALADEIGKIEKMEVSDEENNAYLNQIVEDYGYDSLDDLVQEIEENNEEDRVYSEIIQNKVIDLVIENEKNEKTE